jgi:hypothetical protein
MLRWSIGFVVALAVMVVLGSLAHSYFVQEAWSAAAGQAEGAGPVPLSFAERLNWIGHDLIGLQPLYGIICGVALLIAFLAATLLSRFTGLRAIVFPVAGAVAIFVLFTVMKMQLGTVGVFGARGEMGLGAQMLAGLIAGALFAILTRRQTH